MGVGVIPGIDFSVKILGTNVFWSYNTFFLHIEEHLQKILRDIFRATTKQK